MANENQSIPDDVTEMLRPYTKPAFPRPEGWPASIAWPPFRVFEKVNGKKTQVSVGRWPPENPPTPGNGSWQTPTVDAFADAAFVVLTAAFAEEMAAAAMGRTESQFEEINRGIDQDNQGKIAANSISNIRWEGEVARLMGVSRMIKWKQRPARMQFGDFCRLALIFGMRLEQMPPPAAPETVLELAYARTMNWLLLQMRDGRLPRPSQADLSAIGQSLERFNSAFAQYDAARSEVVNEQPEISSGADDPDDEAEDDSENSDADGNTPVGQDGAEGGKPDPYQPVATIWREFANGWLPPFKVHRQREQLRKLVKGRDSSKVLAFMQQRFDSHVVDLLDNGDYATLILMSNWIRRDGSPVDFPEGYDLPQLPHDHEPDYRMRPVTETIVRKLRQDEYEDITAEHLDAWEVLLDLLIVVPPLNPLNVGPEEFDRGT